MKLESSITYTACPEVQAICQDFFNLTGITYFNFVRAYDDGSRLYLTNSQPWVSFIFNNHQEYSFAFEETTENLQSHYLLWDLIEGARDDPLIRVAREKFNIDHGFTLINRHDDFTEFCYFATLPRNKKLNLFFINNIELLQSFILYFKDKASGLINEAETQKIILKGHSLFWLETSKNGTKSLKEFFKYCDIKRFFLNGELKGVHLTKREAECLSYIFDGKVPKEVGRMLGISHRTVEAHIDAAKLKMRCKNKSSLLSTAKKCGFLNIYETIKANHLSETSKAN